MKVMDLVPKSVEEIVGRPAMEREVAPAHLYPRCWISSDGYVFVNEKAKLLRITVPGTVMPNGIAHYVEVRASWASFNYTQVEEVKHAI